MKSLKKALSLALALILVLGLLGGLTLSASAAAYPTITIDYTKDNGNGEITFSAVDSTVSQYVIQVSSNNGSTWTDKWTINSAAEKLGFTKKLTDCDFYGKLIRIAYPVTSGWSYINQTSIAKVPDAPTIADSNKVAATLKWDAARVWWNTDYNDLQFDGKINGLGSQYEYYVENSSGTRIVDLKTAGSSITGLVHNDVVGIRLKATTSAPAGDWAWIKVGYKYEWCADSGVGFNLGIDYKEETITGFNSNTTYYTGTGFSNITESSSFTNTTDRSITANISNTLNNYIYFVRKATSGKSALAIMEIPKRPAAPTSVGARSASSSVESNGEIYVDNNTMPYQNGADFEFRPVNTTSWLSFKGNVAPVSNGNYEIRVKASNDTTWHRFAGVAASVPVGTGSVTPTAAPTAAPTPSPTPGTTYVNIGNVTFAEANVGYTPASQSISLSTSGSYSGISVTSSSSNFTVSGSGTSWTVRPVSGLSAGTYTTTLYVTYYDAYGSSQSSYSYATFVVKSASTLPYTDVSTGSWYYTDGSIQYVYNKGLIDGISTTLFAPDSVATRAVIVTALWRAAGSPSATSTPFTDVPTTSAYYTAVAWAYSKGITDGIGNNQFGPNASVTREMLAVFFYRYQTLSGKKLSSNYTGAFSDSSTVSSWAATAVSEIGKQGIIEGSNGYFLPKNAATRAELSKMLRVYFSGIGL